MSSCGKISSLLSAYIDGELSEKKRQHVEQHVAKCAACADSLKEMQRISFHIKSLSPINAPPRYEEVLMARMHNPTPRRMRRRVPASVSVFRSGLVYGFSSALAAVFIVSLAWYSLPLLKDRFQSPSVASHRTISQDISSNAAGQTSPSYQKMVSTAPHTTSTAPQMSTHSGRLILKYRSAPFIVQVKNTFPPDLSTFSEESSTSKERLLERHLEQLMTNGGTKVDRDNPGLMCPPCFEQLKVLTFLPGSESRSTELSTTPYLLSADYKP